MSDYLMRSQGPLTDQEWQTLDRVVVQVARRNLVARRFLTIFGPVGAGVQSFAADTFRADRLAHASLFAAEEEDLIAVQARTFVPLPILYHDFRLHWRDLETARRFGAPLETTGAAIAAASVADLEDRVILNGYGELQQQGFLSAEGRQRLPLGDWGSPGGAFATAVNASRALSEAGFRGSYTLVAPPQLFAQLNRVFDNTAVLEIDQIRRLLTGEVYKSPTLPEGVAVVVAAGQENMDLLIAQDVATAFLEPEAMEHYLRVLEILALRIKRPGAICTLGQV